MTENAQTQPKAANQNTVLFAFGCLMAGLVLGGLIAHGLWGKPAPARPIPIAVLPDGWRNLEAPDFFVAVDKLFASPKPPTVEHQREVMEFAWTQFLSDPQFAEQADWPTLQRTIRLIPHKRAELRASRETVAEELVLDQRLSDDIRDFRRRVLERIAADSRILTHQKYLDLIRLATAIDRLGAAPEERRSLFLLWMARNDWQQLTLIELSDLLENIVVAKTVSRAARWTGFITAPATGQYTFSQLRQYRGDPTLKLKVNGEVVLDSEKTDGVSDRFRSQAVSLTAGQPVTLQADIVLDEKKLQHLPEPDVQFGLCLLWEAEGLSRQLIPEKAFSPPKDFPGSHTFGLKGEYFEDVKLVNRVETRLDPALDMMWVSVPVVQDGPQCQLIRNACLAKAQAADVIDGLRAEELQQFAGNNLWRVAGEMRLPERQQFVRALTAKKKLLETTDEFAMGRLLRTIYFLPDKDHLALLQAWSEARPQPHLRLDPIPGSRSGNYYISNFPRLFAVGEFFQGPYWSDAERIWEKHLVGPDGRCNLALAYPTGLAAHDAGIQARKNYLARIETALSSKSLSGDSRATWLLARALAKETFVSGPVRPGMGLDDLESAVTVASTNDCRFWALEELVVRYGALGYSDRADDVLKRFQTIFTDPKQVETMTRWRKETKYLAALYAARQTQRDIEPINAYIWEMQDRLNAAKQGKNAANVERYQKMIDSAESRLKAAREAVAPKLQSLKKAEAELTGQPLAIEK